MDFVCSGEYEALFMLVFDELFDDSGDVNACGDCAIFDGDAGAGDLIDVDGFDLVISLVDLFRVVFFTSL